MAAEKLGRARCPLCGGVAAVSLSKSQLTVLTMNCCQAQLFTRSDKSDMIVRSFLLPPEPAAAPGADIPVTRHEKLQPAVAPVAPTTPTKKTAWAFAGLLGD